MMVVNGIDNSDVMVAVFMEVRVMLFCLFRGKLETDEDLLQLPLISAER